MRVWEWAKEFLLKRHLKIYPNRIAENKLHFFPA